MKSKFHFIKQKIYIQATDGSIVQVNTFSKATILKLNIDPKSHLLWKEFTESTLTENFVTIFMNKYLPKK